MSTVQHSISLQSRPEMGKGASGRLRRANLVPGVVYGGDQPPQHVVVSHHVLIKQLKDEGFYSNIIQLEIDGKFQPALLKALQRHPYKPQILHFDFQRVTSDQILHRSVPLHFINETIAVGVKSGGGTVFHQLRDVVVICKASDLPEYIEVDVAHLELGQSLHLSDLVLPSGVKLEALTLGDDHDLLVVSIQTPRAQVEDTIVEQPAGEK